MSKIDIYDEAQLRLSIRNVYKNEGVQGLLNCIGELSESLTIVLEVSKEIMIEENPNDNT